MSEPISDPRPTFTHELMHREAWHAQLQAEVETATIIGAPASVIFIDVNGFKSINDKLGHVMGDGVIADLGNLLTTVTSQLRFEDTSSPSSTDRTADKISFGFKDRDTAIDALAGHIGGDEYAIFANTDSTGAKAIRERVRSAFNDYIDDPKNQALATLGDIGLAIGVATLEPDMTSSELLHKADEDMYRDKLEQLPPLNEQKERAIWAARLILEGAGVSEAHFVKYPAREL